MKKIPGFPGYYLRLQGSDVEVWSVRPANGRGSFGPPRKLKIHRNKDGYKCVSLQHVSGSVRRGLHQLVLLAYVGPCPDGMVARHLNDVKDDLRPSNLCWGTVEQNNQDKVKNGNSLRGEKHPKAKLTSDQVLDIFARVAAGEDQKALAVEYGVSRQTVSAIKHKQCWSHITN